MKERGETPDGAAARQRAIEMDAEGATRRAARRRRTIRIRSVPLWILAILAMMVAAVAAKSILIPITLAFILQASFGPIVKFLRRRGIGPTVAATLIVTSSLAILAVGTYHLAEPAATWLEELPRNAAQLREKFEEFEGSVAGVKRATEQVEELTEAKPEPGKLRVVVDDDPPLLNVLLSRTTELVISALLTLTLLFLLLANDGAFLRNLTVVLPNEDYRERARLIVLGFEEKISGYLFTITLINAGLGVAVTLALWALGVPTPALWGVMAFVLNYMPYVGAIVGIGIVGLVCLISFDSAMQALVPPLVYLVLTTLEGGLVTPAIIGRKLTLSTAAVLVWLLVWGFMWGIAGALLAFPLLMAFKILCDHLHVLHPIGRLLSTDPVVSTNENDAEPPTRGTPASVPSSQLLHGASSTVRGEPPVPAESGA